MSERDDYDDGEPDDGLPPWSEDAAWWFIIAGCVLIGVLKLAGWLY